MRTLILIFLLVAIEARPSDAIEATEVKIRAGSSGELGLQIDLYRDFSLRYDSFGPVGALGSAFKISGVSGIVRCSKRDQPQSVPTLSALDGLCLSGEILRPVDDQFVPESDPYTRIISRGGNNSTNPAQYTGPDYFEVHSRDGTTSFYGRTPDSKLERIRCGGTTGVACATVQWALNRTVDNVGNYVDYVYLENPVTIPAQADGTTVPGTEQVLRRIEYGGRLNLPGQSAATQAHYGQIEFDYTTRSTATWRIGWTADSREAQTQELTRIRVSERNDQNQLVQLRSYRMSYIDSNSGSGARLLTEIQECRDESVGTVCLKPTKFSWQVGRNVINTAASAQVSSNPDFTDYIVDAEVGDIDADGMQDVVYRTTSRKYYVLFSTWTGTSNFQLQRLSQTPLSLPADTPLDYNLIDMDGDGRDDLVMVSRSGGQDRWVVLRSMGRPLPNQAVFSTTGSQLGNYLAYDDSVVGDFSGDGILDILDVRPNANAVVLGTDHRIRKWQRTSKGPTLSAEIPVRFDFAAGAPCAAQTAGRICKLEKFDGRYQRFLEDADGDGAADLFAFVRVYQNGAPVGDARFHVMRFAGFENSGSPNEVAVFQQLWADTNNSIPPPSASNVRQPPQVADFNGDGLPDILHKVVGTSGNWRFVPNTGKGFAENLSLTAPKATPEWDIAYTSVAETNGNGRVELLRMNNFKSTINEWVPSLTLDANTMRGRLLPGLDIGGGLCPGSLNTTVCGSIAQQGGYFRNYYTDLNGDGVADLLMILHGVPQGNGTTNQQVTFSLAESRYSPRDVITAVEDAFGAKTTVRYLPLTNKAVYVRDVNSRLDPAPNNDDVSSFGRGSPVLDMLSPMFVVAEITSTAPTFADSNAVTRTRYRYAGARVQLGGRGFLGFREVTAFDENHTVGSSAATASTVVTRTRYRQDFPFVGMPELTERFVRTGGLVLDSGDANNNNLLLACHANSEFSQGCFASAPVGTEPREQSHPDFGGEKVSSSRLDYGCLGLGDTGSGAAGEQCAAVWGNQACPADLLTANLALPSGPDQPSPFRPEVNKPVFPFVRLQEDRTFDLKDGTLASSSINGYCYTDGFGNPTQTVSAHFDRTGNEVARQRTFNSYINSVSEVLGTEPVVQWRIGRLASTASTTRRPDPANSGQFLTRSRNANYLYDFTAPMRTGLLIGESAEPGAGEAAAPFLRQRYFHDVFGNRTLTMQCSSDVPVTDCDDPTDVGKVRMQPAAAGLGARVHRYSKVQFDSRGRYESATRSPYYSATATNNLVELTDSEVLTRDAYGQPTHVRKLVDQNTGSYAESKSEYGVLGRLSRTMTETAEGLFGVESNIRYRWCRGRNQGVDEVDCPADTVYRQETTTTQQPTVWTYFDALARPVIEIKQSFNDPLDQKLELRSDFANKQLVASCVYFDRRGREARRSEPFFLTRAPVGGAPSFNNGADAPCGAAQRLWTLRDYDALDRPRRVTEPNDAYTDIKIGRAISLTADPLSERRETFRGQSANDILSETVQKNPLGEVISTTDMQGLSVLYFYDAYGNQTRVARDGGGGVVETIHEFDALGRKVSENDPDSGTSMFAYNGAGEVVRTEDARGVVVSNEYDARGRLVKRSTRLPRFSIGGQVTGLSGGSLTLQLNGASDIMVSQSGTFIFADALTLNSDYLITIVSAPAATTCTVQNGQGSLISSNISNVSVQCVQATFTVGGTLTGLTAGNILTLRNGANQQTLVLTQNGSFGFASLLANNTSYAITVQTQPTQQTCTITNGAGTVSGSNVVNIQVTCATNTYSVGGNLTGLLPGRSLTLQLNGANNLLLSADGSFQFTSRVAHGNPFTVTVANAPTGQNCTIANSTGTISGANVGNVNVSCVQRPATFASTPAPFASVFFGGLLSGQTADRTITMRNTASSGSASYTINCAFQPGVPIQILDNAFPLSINAGEEKIVRFRITMPASSNEYLLQCSHNAGGAGIQVNWEFTANLVSEQMFQNGFESP